MPTMTRSHFQRMADVLCSNPSGYAWAWDLLKRMDKGQVNRLDLLGCNPASVMMAAGLAPDPWQQTVLESPADRISLLCSRQVGKSTIAAAVAVKTALIESPATIVVISPSERQSGELMHKVRGFYEAMQTRRRLAANQPRPVVESAVDGAQKDALWFALPKVFRESALQLHLKNGSRIIGLPGSESTVRGYSGVSLLIIDEAARVPDDLYRAVRPMLATSKGRLLALTTPFGKRGWFFEEWEGVGAWQRIRVTAPECQRIPAEFLAEEQRSLGDRWYRQEYLCEYCDTVDCVFAMEYIQAAIVHDVKPLMIQWHGEA